MSTWGIETRLKSLIQIAKKKKDKLLKLKKVVQDSTPNKEFSLMRFFALIYYDEIL
jgi:hypothetical protein